MPILTPAGAVVTPTGTSLGAAVSVTLGAVTLGVTDDYGVRWILQDVKGWSDPPSSTGEVPQRAADHGGWASPAYYAPRVIEIEGSLVADSWAIASDALTRLWAAIPLQATDWLYVTEGSRTLCALVRQDGDPLVERQGGWARFSLSLEAPDPRRYDANETTANTGLPATTGGMALPLALPLTIGATIAAGVLSVTNDGNMGTRPTFTVAGPVAAGATITHRGTGKVLRIPDGVPAGRKLTIDTDRRRALLDGTAARVVTGTWFEYAPGVNEVAFSAPSYNSGALLTSTHRSAWR